MEVKEALAAYKIVHGTTHDLADVRAFVATLDSLDSNPKPEARTLFDTSDFGRFAVGRQSRPQDCQSRRRRDS